MIKLVEVSKVFINRDEERVLALNSIDLTIEEGEFVMITGPSGSGKSTLLFTVGALLTPSEGEVFIGDKNIYKMSSRMRAKLRLKTLGLVFQTFNLIPFLTCLENAAMLSMLAGNSRQKAKDKAVELLDRLGLKHRLNHRPFELSIGEQQRLALARALINDPRIILADEPTGNLDHDNAMNVVNILKELNKEGLTVVMATHDRRLADRADRVISLIKGTIVRDDRVS